MRVIISFLAALCILFSLQEIAFAYRIEPTVIDVIVNAEEEWKYITLTNDGDQEVVFSIDLVEIKINEENGMPEIIGPFLPTYAQMDSSAHIPPHTSQSLALHILPPEGESLNSILGIRLIAAVDQNAQIPLATGFLIPVFIRSADLPLSLSLLQTITTAPVFGSQVTVESLLKNTSQTVIQPIGKVQIKSLFNKTIAELDMNPHQKRIPAQLSRAFTTTWNHTSPSWNPLTILSEPFGYYRIDTVYRVSDMEEVNTSYALILSPKKGLMIGFLLGAFGGIIILRRKRI